MQPSAPGTLLKKECSPFDKKCKEKLKTMVFRKPKKKRKGKKPVYKSGPAEKPETAKAEPKETDREFQYTVTYPSGETRLMKEKRDTSISLQEQIKKARKEALRVRAEKKAD